MHSSCCRYIHRQLASPFEESIRLTTRDGPFAKALRAFWSVIAYDANGFFPKNDLGIYSHNNVSAKRNADGFITIRSRGDMDQIKYLPSAYSWNYTIRMNEPDEEILNGFLDPAQNRAGQVHYK